MEHEYIFWFGVCILSITMTGGMWMFMESKRFVENKRRRQTEELRRLHQLESQ